MINKLARVTILVRDQDEALRFYTEVLGLEVREDQVFGPGVRWLTVAPKGQNELEIVLMKPEPALLGEAQAKKLLRLVGKGTHWVFYTESCRQTYQDLKGKGVKFISPPQEQVYGVEALFEDLYGNTFSLLERGKS